jgi:hypothetical protein
MYASVIVVLEVSMQKKTEVQSAATVLDCRVLTVKHGNPCPRRETCEMHDGNVHDRQEDYKALGLPRIRVHRFLFFVVYVVLLGIAVHSH